MGLISRVSSRTYRFLTRLFLKRTTSVTMLIYKDFISNDELCSDSFPTTWPEEYDGCIMEVTGRNRTEAGGIDDALIGGNASADGADADAGADDGASSGIDVVMNHNLSPSGFGKKDFKVYMGAWFKKAAKWVEENKGKERADIFKKDGMVAFKEIFGKFKEVDLYVGENMDPDGSLVFGMYREDGITPYFWYFKDALEEEKF